MFCLNCWLISRRYDLRRRLRSHNTACVCPATDIVASTVKVDDDEQADRHPCSAAEESCRRPCFVTSGRVETNICSAYYFLT